MTFSSFMPPDIWLRRCCIAITAGLLSVMGSHAVASPAAALVDRYSETARPPTHAVPMRNNEASPENRPLRRAPTTEEESSGTTGGASAVAPTRPLQTENQIQTDPHMALSTTPDTQRTIEFSGFTWEVRDRYGRPGPNEWSDSEESVWVDEDGRLHLKIRKVGSEWHSAELSTVAALGYGTYTFTVASDVEAYDENVVVGLFTYRNGPEEIDIEFSKWGGAFPERNGTYTVWSNEDIAGVGRPTATERFDLNLSGRPSTHQFTWTNHRVGFRSWHGRRDEPTQSTLIREWAQVGTEIPDADDEKLHLNFWLFQGSPPAGTTEPELVITSVDYRSQQVRADRADVSVYPHPIRERGTIEYTVPERSSVTLEIYDLMGRRLQTLVREDQRAGVHRVEWPSGDSKPLPAGTYFYRLQIGTESTLQKVTVLR